MKRPLRIEWILFLLLWTACDPSDRHAGHQTEYTCPMHPTVVNPGPGICPVCRMDLVTAGESGGDAPLGDEASLIQPVQERIVSKAAVIRPAFGKRNDTISATATVIQDDRKRVRISVRAAGRLVSVNARIPDQYIRAGETLATLYSPEITEAQQEYLNLFRNNRQATRTRLLQLGFTDDLFRELEKQNRPLESIPLRSPVSGVRASATSPDRPLKGDQDMMPKNQGSASTGTEPSPGMAVTAGQTIFEIIPAEARWLDIQVPTEYSGNIRNGNPVQVYSPDGHGSQWTRIELVNKINEGKPYVRMIAPLAGMDLPLGTLVSIRMVLQSDESVWIPNSALLNLGKRSVVFIRRGTEFRPRSVTSGRTVDGQVEILSGLGASEEIAQHAGMLVDSDSFIPNFN